MSSRHEPLAPATHRKQTDLNETLNTAYIDVPPEDTSVTANLTRTIAGFVGQIFTPRQMLIILRVLKALTFGFLVLTIMADLMYLVFVQSRASNEVSQKVGGTRDTIIRGYGLLLTWLALAIELDTPGWIRAFPGLKGFIPRALLLFFVATITGAHPLHEGRGAVNNSNGDDDALVDDDIYHDEQVSSEIPKSTVVFQMVTSWCLGGCALIYLILGCLCFDRFRSKAFLSSRDPLRSTAIPGAQPSATGMQPDDNSPQLV